MIKLYQQEIYKPQYAKTTVHKLQKAGIPNDK